MFEGPSRKVEIGSSCRLPSLGNLMIEVELGWKRLFIFLKKLSIYKDISALIWVISWNRFTKIY